jgi:hypothetical protein
MRTRRTTKASRRPTTSLTTGSATITLRAIEVVPLRNPDGSSIVGRATMRALVAIAEAVFSRNGAPPASERLSWIEREMEDFLARAGFRSRLMFSFMVWLTTLIAPLLSGRFTLLYGLPLAERVRAVELLERRFSEPLLAVKALLCLVYYEHPDAARDVGFDGECLLPRRSGEVR